MTDWAIDIVIKEDLAKALYDSWSETLPREREWFDEPENVQQSFLRSAEVMLSVPAVRFAFEDSEVLANTTNTVRDLLQEVEELHDIVDDFMFERDALAQDAIETGHLLEYLQDRCDDLEATLNTVEKSRLEIFDSYESVHRVANRSLDLVDELQAELDSLTATKNNKRRWFRRKK